MRVALYQFVGNEDECNHHALGLVFRDFHYSSTHTEFLSKQIHFDDVLNLGVARILTRVMYGSTITTKTGPHMSLSQFNQAGID